MKQFERQISTLILIGLIVWLLCMLSGCKSKQTAIKENVEISKIDTTKTKRDSTITARVEKGSTAAIVAGSDSMVFEFVDSGGSVRIDNEGNISATGVKKIRAGATYHKDETTATETTEKGVWVNNETNKGVTNKENRKTEKSEKPVKPSWYEYVILWVPPVVCIAVILWVIFLYIRRKF